MLLQARREALTAERRALSDVVRTGLIENSVAEDISVELEHSAHDVERLSSARLAGSSTVADSGASA